MSRARRGAGALILALLLAGAIAAPAPGAALKQVGGFQEPIDVTGAPGFPDLLFVAEQQGRIKVINKKGKVRRSFLNITGLVNYGGERGLLSIAFHPGYKRNRLFYVYYTDSQGDLHIDEFKRRSSLVAGNGSRRTVIDIPHRVNSNHNGGEIQFLGQHLYLSTGDGGSGGDPPDNAKNLDSLLGKLIRIDPRNAPGDPAYRVPSSNPFVGRDGRDEIFSYGLRNPFRFSFDTVTAAKPRIVIGDVGQERFEEIDYEKVSTARGGFFGWDEFEGFAPYECDGACAENSLKPIFAYGSGCAVIGGYVVRDRSLGGLFGRYLFSDNCDGTIRSLSPRLGRVSSAPPTGLSVSSPSSFGEDRRGRVYITSLEGPVYRIVPGG